MGKDFKPGMLTYEDAEPVKVHAPRVEMIPVRRQGFIGRIMDRIFGTVKKPQAVMVLDKEAQERLREKMKKMAEHETSQQGQSLLCEK